jgi:hypothetical protein
MNVYLEIGPATEDNGAERYATMFPKERSCRADREPGGR